MAPVSICNVVRVLAIALLASSLQLALASEPLQPGEYVRSRDSGWLKLERRNGGTFFLLESIGGNCHSCGVSGRVVGTLGEAEAAMFGTEPEPGVCRIRMTPSLEGRQIEVEPLTEHACRPHCGMRARLDGVYRKPPPRCTKAGQQQTRDRFLRHYRSRQYPQAVAVLRPMLDECGEFLNWIEADRVRNDLALAYRHAGSREQCAQTLGQTLASGHADEGALRNRLPPCDFDNYIATARATWHNLRLCGARAGRPR